MNAKRLVLLGQLKEAIQSKEPNMVNHCTGLINSLIDLETKSVGMHLSDTGITFVNDECNMERCIELISKKERMMK